MVATKELDHFVELANMIPDEYRIVLIGISEQQIAALPSNVLGIKETKNIETLAKWYTAADVFVNPSVEERFGMVTVEAMACGTPVIAFSRTAVPEVVTDDCGVVCAKNDAKTIKYELEHMKAYSPGDCVEASKRYTKAE